MAIGNASETLTPLANSKVVEENASSQVTGRKVMLETVLAAMHAGDTAPARTYIGERASGLGETMGEMYELFPGSLKTTLGQALLNKYFELREIADKL